MNENYYNNQHTFNIKRIFKITIYEIKYTKYSYKQEQKNKSENIVNFKRLNSNKFKFDINPKFTQL